MMRLTSRSQYKAAIIRLVALYCLLLPNCAVPPQDNIDAPCTLQQEEPSLIHTDTLKEKPYIGTPDAGNPERSTVYQADQPGSSSSILRAPAPQLLDPGIEDTHVQPKFQQEISGTGAAAAVAEPHLTLHASEGAQLSNLACMGQIIQAIIPNRLNAMYPEKR